MSANLELQRVQKRFGGVVVTNDVSLSIPSGSLIAVIGPNGAGKTTLFNLITGHLQPDAGRIVLDGDDLVGLTTMAIVRKGIGRSFQIASLFPTFSVREAVASVVLASTDRLRRPIGEFPSPDALGRADEMLGVVGLSHCADMSSSALSHGDQKLLDIAMAVALDPRVLLLDEPMAGMGREERQIMTKCIRRLHGDLGMTLVFIEHDMDVVFSLAQKVGVLHQGSLIAFDEPGNVRANPAVVSAYLGTEEE